MDINFVVLCAFLCCSLALIVIELFCFCFVFVHVFLSKLSLVYLCTCGVIVIITGRNIIAISAIIHNIIAVIIDINVTLRPYQ